MKMLLSKYKKIKVNISGSLLEAMEQMSNIFCKLLLVVENDEYRGLISIGDIQRDFLKYHDFTRKIESAMRKEYKVAYDSMLMDDIKELMLKHRTEFMPVLNQNNGLVDIIFWENVFGNDQKLKLGNLDLPVVIMAGGKGTRLKPITNIIPKPLIPIGEKAIVQVIMDRFRNLGCNQFFMTVNYKHELIRYYFDELEDKYNIKYFKEDYPLGTAGSLHLMRNELKTTFFVSNCDIIIDQDYEDIYEYHVNNGNELTIVATVKNYSIPYGTLDLDDEGLLKQINEKPSTSVLINSGLYILEPKLIQEIPDNEFFHITHLMEKIIARGGKIGVFPINESSWMDVGEWQEYKATLMRHDIDINI